MKTVTMVYAGDLKAVANAIYQAIPSLKHFCYDRELARLTVDTDQLETVSRIVSDFPGYHLTWLQHS